VNKQRKEGQHEPKGVEEKEKKEVQGEEEFLARWASAPLSEVAREMWRTQSQVRELTAQVEGLLGVTKARGEETRRMAGVLDQACRRIVAVEMREHDDEVEGFMAAQTEVATKLRGE